jgi:hypothetical protein
MSSESLADPAFNSIRNARPRAGKARPDGRGHPIRQFYRTVAERVFQHDQIDETGLHRRTWRRGVEWCRIETVLMPLTEDGASVSPIFRGLSIRRILSDRATGQNSPRDFSIPFAGVASDGMDSRHGPAIRDYR